MNTAHTTSPASRKHPRATIEEPGVITVREWNRRAPARRLQVTIRSISHEGVGLALADGRGTLDRRANATLDFKVGGRRFEIPGSIVWVAGPSAPPGPLDVGVRFVLAAVTSETREAYARWVLGLLDRQGVRMQPPDQR